MDTLQRAFYPIDGNGKITVGDIVSIAGGGAGSVKPATVDTLEGATTTGKAVMKATTAEAARTAIGAGTSNLTIGTTATTAKAGNYAPPTVTTSANGLMLSADKTKLDGIVAGATKNATDAQLRDRSTHTGSQAISTVTGLQAALDDLSSRIAALKGAST